MLERRRPARQAGACFVIRSVEWCGINNKLSSESPSRARSFPKAKWLRWFAGLLAFAGLVAWIGRESEPREPVYEGKPLSQYLPDLLLKPKDENAYAGASNAVVALGTNALPFLISEATVKTPVYSQWYVANIDKVPNRLRTRLNARFGTWIYQQRRRSALQALKILGEKAAPASPALIDFFPYAGPNDWWMLSTTLSEIGEDSIDLLVPHLKSGDLEVRRQACFVVHQLANSPKAVLAVPALIDGLSHPDANYRQQAAAALGRIGEPAVPHLKEAFAESAASHLPMLIQTVHSMQQPGREMAPELIGLLDHEEPEIRSRSALALCQHWPFVWFDAGDASHEKILTMMREKAEEGEPMFVRMEQVVEARPQIAAGLRDGLADSDPSVQMECAGRMVRYHLDDSEVLLAVLQGFEAQPDSRWQREAARLLSQLESRQAD